MLNEAIAVLRKSSGRAKTTYLLRQESRCYRPSNWIPPEWEACLTA